MHREFVTYEIIMKEKTLKSYQENGYRVQLVVIYQPQFDIYQLRVNRKRLFSCYDFNQALKVFRNEVVEHINTLSFFDLN